MKLKIFIFLMLYGLVLSAQQKISDFISVTPATQNSDFIIPPTHSFQKIIVAGDALTEGGTLPIRNDFAGFVPINGSSENGYLSINAETIPGGVTILDVQFDPIHQLWETTKSEAIDFSNVVGTIFNCSGAVTPWNTIISCEEGVVPTDLNGDGHNDTGWCMEIDPVSRIVTDKLWVLGNFQHENVTIHPNHRTLYQGVDDIPGYLYKFVADNAQDLSSGKLYVYRGSKNGSGEWILLRNTTPAERNATITQSENVGATTFAGIEDVEISPDGWVYFAVKNEASVYRFLDSDPITGTTVLQMETYVGNTAYTIAHDTGSSNVTYVNGNDNLAFDGDGNLWVLVDDSEGFQNYIWVVENGHTQANPKVKIFARTPIGAEPTGITFSPDYRFLFMSIQHPDENNASSQIDVAGNPVLFNTGTTLVISRNEHLGTPTSVWYLDFDGDGFAAETTVTSSTSPGTGYTTTVLPTTDCNDNDADINPNTIWYLDFDGDGFAAAIPITSCISPGSGYTNALLPTTDCNDNDATINASTTWYLDADGDGFAAADTLDNCGSPGAGYTTNVLPTTDCDDNDPAVNGSSTWYLDFDGDGFAAAETAENCGSPGTGYTTNMLPTTDCDDNDPAVNRSSTWYLDFDGDGFAASETVAHCGSPGTGYTLNVLPTTDCDDNDPAVNGSSTWYLDFDGDGFAASETVENCGSPGTGYTLNVLPITDCDDNDPAVNGSSVWYLDFDGDGFAAAETVENCGSPGTGYTTAMLPTTDCDDNDGSVNAPTIWYLDADGDGFAATETVERCGSPGAGYTTTELPNSDCDDNDVSVNRRTNWYLDADGDGFADTEPVLSCGSPGANYTADELPPKINTGEFSSYYPNPTTSSIRIDLGQTYKNLKILLANTLNQSIHTENLGETDAITIDLSGHESGVYFLKVTSEGRNIDVLKLIKR